MGKDPHPKAIEIFNDALEVDGVERDAFLAEVGANDPSLVAEVRVLLAVHAEAEKSSFLEPQEPRGDEGSGHCIAEHSAAESMIGQRFGSYKIVDVLGEGGMGVVYRAQQEHPHRTVALKVIRPGFVSEGMLRRFEHEAEVLGRLQHPGIAQIFEAGSAETSHGQQPFFAMELVSGPRLTSYAEANQLTSRQRLELMARVCDAAGLLIVKPPPAIHL